MKGNAIGLLGIAAWLLGVAFVVAGMAGLFNTQVSAPKPGATLHHPIVAKRPVKKEGPKAPKEHWGLKEYFPLSTCTGGDLEYTWRTCTKRFNA